MPINVFYKKELLGVIEENPETNQSNFIAEDLVCLENLLRRHPYDELDVGGKHILYTDFRREYMNNFGGFFIRKTPSPSQ